MRIIIDGDACPQRQDIIKLAEKYNKEIYLFIDYSHHIDENFTHIYYCDISKDEVDQQIIKFVKNNDLVITQDYGLACLLLSKKVKVLHVNGFIINNDNIDELLLSRYTSAKQRKKNKHIKGPKKRDKKTEEYFLKQLEGMIK
jgi:hypothetical protein